MCPSRDALLGIIYIHEAGYTYRWWRIQGKCGYPCVTPNAILRIVVRSARHALLGIVSIYGGSSTWGRDVRLGNAITQSRAFGVGHALYGAIRSEA